MNRITLLALLILLLTIAGLGTIRPAIMALAIPLVVYLLAGLWGTPEGVELRAERTLSAERVQTGDDVLVTVTITNHGHALEDILLEDQVPEGLKVVDGSSRRRTSLAVGGSLQWSYSLRGKRGYYSLRKVRASIREHLGLMETEKELRTDGQLFILPPVLRLRRIAIRPRRTRIFSGTIPARQGGSGVEFFDVREYQQGDSPRWINWRATARHSQNIFTNEYEQERSADVGIVLDGRRRTNEFGEFSLFEYSVLATAALADAFLESGNRVGLLFYGRQIGWTMPGYGKLQGERILHDLSLLEPGDSQNFNELYIPRHMFPSRSQLVLVSSLISEDYDMLVTLRMRGFPLMIISPDSVNFEVSRLMDSRATLLAARILKMQRAVLLRRLRGAGIHVVDWDTSQPFEKVAKGELQRRLILPRGELL